MTDVITTTQFIEGFIPQEIFVLIFIFAMVFFILSFLIQRGGIVFSVVSCIMTLFLGYCTFFLRWNTDYVPVQTNIIDGVQNVTTILEINQMFLCQPLLFLLIGLFALSVTSLWMNVAKYTEQTMKESIEKNKELKKDDGIV